MRDADVEVVLEARPPQTALDMSAEEFHRSIVRRRITLPYVPRQGDQLYDRGSGVLLAVMWSTTHFGSAQPADVDVVCEIVGRGDKHVSKCADVRAAVKVMLDDAWYDGKLPGE